MLSTQKSELLSIEMEMNSLTMSYGGGYKHIEEGFLDDYSGKSLQRVRFSLFLWILFYALFGILDNEIMPEMKNTLWLIRYAIICPSIIGIIFFSFSPAFKRYMQLILFTITTISGLGIIYIIVIAPHPYNFSYYTALIIVLVLGYTFSRMRFIWAMSTGWIIIISYEFVALWFGSDMHTSILVDNNVIFVIANIIGMFACYFMEYYARRDYFMTLLLEEEREKVSRANIKLESRVQNRTAQLEKTNKELEKEISVRKRTERKLLESQEQLIQNEKLAALGKLSGIAHQIRNPLEIILMGTEFLGNSLDKGDSRIELSLKKIIQAVNRANKIITDILRFSRTSELKFESVDLTSMVDEMLELIESKTAGSGIRILRNYPKETIKIEADKNMIQQVFINLLSNAHDAMTNGGEIKINIYRKTTSETMNHIGYRDEDYFKIGEQMAVVEIKDTGEGIPEDMLQKIFEPFFTTKKSGKGTGLGLSMAHLIIDRHRGIIDVESRMNEGTKFTLKLQLSKT